MTISVVPGAPMPPDESTRHWAVLAKICTAREAFDPTPMISLFADDAVYESQSVLSPLEGREEIADYLIKRFAFFAELASTRDTGRLIPGVVDLPEASEHPCLIFEADGNRQALWVLELTEGGLIGRLDILTVAPAPYMAREVI